ncbi:MAG: branched-chain amino acid ABC transporter permease [Ktedonobacterales bacterium]
MTAIVFYATTLLVFWFDYNILTWGLNIQFGYTGILNFAFIVFMAIGAYVSGVFSLPQANGIAGQTYVLGLSWPFPLTLLMGGLAAAALGFFVGLIALKRLRSDYMAIVTVAVGAIAYDFIGNVTGLFNGWDGLGSVPQPLQLRFNIDYNTYQIVYVVLAGVVALILWWFANRIYASPFGRTLRSIREDQDVSEAFGKNTYKYRMLAMIIGCFYAGIAGGILIGFTTALNPSGWTTGETFVVWTALLVGGTGNNWGAILGALLVPVGFQEATRFLPQLSDSPTLIPALRNIIVGGLLILVLWFRPQGIIPEKKARYNLFGIPLRGGGSPGGPAVATAPSVATTTTTEDPNVAAG